MLLERTDELGSQDEQYQAFRGGGRAERADIQPVIEYFLLLLFLAIPECPKLLPDNGRIVPGLN